MKKFFFTLIYALALTSLACAQGDAPFPKAKKVLLINSYHHSMTWSLYLEEGIRQHLFHDKRHNLFIEYLDVRRKSFDEERDRYIVWKLMREYGHEKFDLILVTDDPALAFLNKHYDSLSFLHSTPMIAASISNEDLTRKMQQQGSFVFKEVLQNSEMVKEILQLFPKTRQFYIITQDDPVGMRFRQNFIRQMKGDEKISSEIDFQFNGFNDIEHIVQEIANLPKNSIILIYNFGGNEDEDLYYPIDEQLTMIKQNSNLPIFCMIQSWVMNGVVGGYVLDSKQQGALLGEKAMEYLNGAPFKAGVDSTSIQQEWLFNRKILSDYGIPKWKLPAKSELIGTPENSNIYLVIISVTLVILLILIYFINRVLKKRIRSQTHHLRNEINKFEFFVSEMPIGYIALSVKYDILRWNRSAEKIFGWSSDDVKGRNMSHFFSMTGKVTELIKGDNHTTHHFTSHSKNKEGKEVLCEWYITQYSPVDGKPLLFVLVLDVTEKEKLRENLEILLDKTKKMMLQNDRYIAYNIHDIKNLTLPILVYSEMMMDDDLPLEKRKRMTRQLHESAETLLEMSTNLLEINKLKNNAMDSKPEVFNIYLKTQEIVVVLDVPITTKKINLSNQINKQQTVFADPEMVNSILLNLLNNAIKFIPEEGNITIRSTVLDHDFVQIDVIDSGIGINEEEIDQIFSLKKYLTRKGTSGEKGTGLGLMLSKDLIEKNGGTLSYQKNTDGPGSTFSFTLKTK